MPHGWNLFLYAIYHGLKPLALYSITGAFDMALKINQKFSIE
jgi:hypothetical protein